MVDSHRDTPWLRGIGERGEQGPPMAGFTIFTYPLYPTEGVSRQISPPPKPMLNGDPALGAPCQPGWSFRSFPSFQFLLLASSRALFPLPVLSESASSPGNKHHFLVNFSPFTGPSLAPFLHLSTLLVDSWRVMLRICCQ